MKPNLCDHVDGVDCGGKNDFASFVNHYRKGAKKVSNTQLAGYETAPL